MTTKPSFIELKRILAQAYAQGIASSLSLSVWTPDAEIICHEGETSPHHKTNDETIYDLASLTKILGTTIATAKAVLDKMIDLDETPFPYWPESSIKSILTHTAQLMAHRRFYEDLALSDHDFLGNKIKIKDDLKNIQANHPKVRLYSDVGFINLGFLLEDRYQKPLDAIFCDAWQAFKVAPFYWFSSQAPPAEVFMPDVAQTYCHARNLKRQGQVHDANCHYLGGLAAHAGLFGTTSMVSHAGARFLACINHPQNALEEIIAQWAAQGIGFDKPSPQGTNAMLAQDAFGHFGYTGVSLFVDPTLGEHGASITLLTNRIYKGEDKHGIFWLRKTINQAVKNAF